MKRRFQKRSFGKEDGKTDGEAFVTNGASEINCTISSYTEAGI
jgi:hypothetical protein